MAELLDFIRTTIEQIIEALGYPGIALVMLIENIFPPIPSEVVMPFAGFLVADTGHLSFVGIVIAGTIGSVLGAILLYWIGAWADEIVVRRFVRRFGRYFLLDEGDLDRALSLFARYGEIIVFVGRVIPVVRSVISVPAGMQRMPFGRFLVFTLLGSTVWTTALSYSGYILGENWEHVLEFVDRYQFVTLIVVGIVALVFITRRVRSRLTGSEADSLFRSPKEGRAQE